MAGALEVELLATAEHAEHAVRLEDAGDLEELRELLAEALETQSEDLVLDLRPEGPPRVTLPAALELAVRLAEQRGALRLRCLVASERVAAQLHRVTPAGRARCTSASFGLVAVELLQADLTTVTAEAVVNASNTRLKLGGGVSAALRRACDAGLQPAMSAQAPLEVGGVAVTGGHGLPGVRAILHVATASGSEEAVRLGLRAALRWCEVHEAASLAVPALGTGSGGLPRERCAELSRAAFEEHGARAKRGLLVRMALWSAADFEAFERALR